ncbi:MAG: ABC transporter substrate-binding protein [Alphaproteobacteria bacterium]|nr:ABC transporter substrate-binding protein [Alphaproteobacteria bacterium]
MSKIRKGMKRRQFLGTAASAAAFTAPYVKRGHAAETVRIGFNAPVTGDVAAWGLPGLYGCEIWAEKLNAAGGINVGGTTYNVELVSYDNEYLSDKALTGAKQLVLEDGVKIVLQLGGTDALATAEFMTKNKMLSSTLVPSDLSPETTYLVAPCEVHPLYNSTGVEWLARNKPELKTVAMVTQDDTIGRPSVALYRAAFEVTGMELVHDSFFDLATTDFAPIMTAMLASKPDVLCFDTAYPDFINLLNEQAFLQGYEGTIISCTLDNYPVIMEKTSAAFLEGHIFQFPDFDDQALNQPQINFKNANDFYAEYTARYPGSWNAVSWEYAAILELWKTAAEKAGSVEPDPVLEAMKAGGKGDHAFGPASWWGEELFGINNALVGAWPVVQMQNGKATIVEYGDIPTWWEKAKDATIKHFEELGEMWYQRT